MEYMNMKFNNLKKIIPIVLLGSLVFGQGSRMGTASSTQLQIVQGARYLTGGGAAATAVGLDAAYWNPAGLALSGNNVEALFSYRQYIADITNNFFGTSLTLGGFGTFGLTARTFDIGSITETTVFYPDGTGQEIETNFIILGATFSKQVAQNTSFGVTANFVREEFGRVEASGLAFDIGVQYKGLLKVEGLNVGLVLKNFGRPMRYTGEGLGRFANDPDANRPVEYYKVDAAEFQLPFTFEMGAAYQAGAITLGATYVSNYYSTDAIKALGEFDLGILAVRAGYQKSNPAKEEVDFGGYSFEEWDYENPFDGLSFGGTLNLKSLIGTNISIDAAYLPASVFDDNLSIAVRMGF